MGLVANTSSLVGASLSRNVINAPESKISQANLFLSVIVTVGRSVAPVYPNRDERLAFGLLLGSLVGCRELG